MGVPGSNPGGPMILNAGGMGTGGRWKDLKLNAALHFPHPAFHEKRHEVPLVDGVREVEDYPPSRQAQGAPLRRAGPNFQFAPEAR
jgi:hypothetical protein